MMMMLSKVCNQGYAGRVYFVGAIREKSTQSTSGIAKRLAAQRAEDLLQEVGDNAAPDRSRIAQGAVLKRDGDLDVT